MINKLYKKNKLSVGVIGLGYVGLPLCTNFLKKGIRVFGVDIDKKKIKLIRKKKIYFKL